jgi:hypothetical protein
MRTFFEWNKSRASTFPSQYAVQDAFFLFAVNRWTIPIHQIGCLVKKVHSCKDVIGLAVIWRTLFNS